MREKIIYCYLEKSHCTFSKNYVWRIFSRYTLNFALKVTNGKARVLSIKKKDFRRVLRRWEHFSMPKVDEFCVIVPIKRARKTSVEWNDKTYAFDWLDFFTCWRLIFILTPGFSYTCFFRPHLPWLSLHISCSYRLHVLWPPKYLIFSTCYIIISDCIHSLSVSLVGVY